MGIVRAFTGALTGTFADQWKEIITAGPFDEHSVVVPGVVKRRDNSKGRNYKGSGYVVSSGSKIFVPENTAAFVFNQSGIEAIIGVSGGYVYQGGEKSVFNGDGLDETIREQVHSRIGYGGISASETKVAFVNLREIRNIKFGTHGPQVYNDLFYGVDMEIFAHGTFSVQVTDPVAFIKNFVPANTLSYSFDDPDVRSQLIAEFLQSFSVALNSLSSNYRISQIPSQTNEIAKAIAADEYNAGSWKDRFGLQLVKVAIENIQFSDDSRELVHQYAEKKMDMRAYEDVSQRTSNIAAQQKIAKGIQDNGFGDGAGVILGMNYTQNLGKNMESEEEPSFDEQIEMLKKLKELMDAGILTQDEFEKKKKEILDL